MAKKKPENQTTAELETTETETAQETAQETTETAQETTETETAAETTTETETAQETTETETAQETAQETTETAQETTETETAAETTTENEAAQETTENKPPVTEKKKETRGRKRKILDGANAGEKPETDNSNVDLLKATKNAGKKEIKRISLPISGALFLMVIDGFIPNILCFVIGKVDKKVTVKSEDIKLTKEQKDELYEVAGEVAKIIFGNMHPLAAFFTALGFCYAGNIMSYNMLKKIK